MSFQISLWRPRRLIRNDTFRLYLIFARRDFLETKNVIKAESVVPDLGWHFIGVFRWGARGLKLDTIKIKWALTVSIHLCISGHMPLIDLSTARVKPRPPISREVTPPKSVIKLATRIGTLEDIHKDFGPNYMKCFYCYHVLFKMC